MDKPSRFTRNGDSDRVERERWPAAQSPHREGNVTRIRGGSGRPFAPGGPRGFRASTLRPLKSHLDLRKLSFGSNPLTSISPRVPKLGIMGLPILSKKDNMAAQGPLWGLETWPQILYPNTRCMTLDKSLPFSWTHSYKGCLFPAPRSSSLSCLGGQMP